MNRELEGQVALVTGAGNGIGRATALAFAREGARVVVSDVDGRGGEQTVVQIRSAGGAAQFAAGSGRESHRRRINAVCPGFIATPMLERAGLLSDDAIRKSLEDMHAMKRLGTSEEVAEAVVFLASARSSFVTGHPLLVDGGFASM